MIRRVVLIFSLLLFIPTFSHAGYTFRKGKIIHTDLAPIYSAEGHFRKASEAFNAKDFREAAKQYKIVSYNFPNSSYGKEAQFYLGVSYFYDEEYDFANDALTAYINCDSSPKYFECAIEYKLEIARRFQSGAKKRFFGTRMLPKLAPARHLAVDVYNEVISALPCHELAAYALYLKGCLHAEDSSYKESVEAFQTLIRRFPKHELAPESYLCINKVYLTQSCYEFQNPDILALAEINARRFENDFPKEERVEEAKADVLAIKEMFAKGLYDTGQFYERKNRETASIIYYRTAILKFPETHFATRAQRRLNWLLRENSEHECLRGSFDASLDEEMLENGENVSCDITS